MVVIFTIRRVSQLFTDHTGIIVIPVISANTTPYIIQADFNSSIVQIRGLENKYYDYFDLCCQKFNQYDASSITAWIP